MTVRIPRRAARARQILLALGAALALASAPLPAGADGASTEPRACPAEPTGTIDLEADVLRIREQIAHQAPPAPGEGEMLNSRGYNYGGAGGAMLLPASRDVEAELPR